MDAYGTPWKPFIEPNGRAPEFCVVVSRSGSRRNRRTRRKRSVSALCIKRLIWSLTCRSPKIFALAGSRPGLAPSVGVQFAALARLDLSLDLRRQLSSYSIAIQQMVPIARALDISAKLLILDEPTSSLDKTEVEELFKKLRKLREGGLGVIFITHFLEQVYEISDLITVLRNGRRVGCFATRELSRIKLVSHRQGRPGGRGIGTEASFKSSC
jgi:hypothetical protein